MLLEVKACNNDVFYDKVVPMLTLAGLQARDDLRAPDPDSDGEMVFLYYELTKSLRLSEFHAHMMNLEKFVQDNVNGDPTVMGLSLVPSR